MSSNTFPGMSLSFTLLEKSKALSPDIIKHLASYPCMRPTQITSLPLLAFIGYLEKISLAEPFVYYYTHLYTLFDPHQPENILPKNQTNYKIPEFINALGLLIQEDLRKRAKCFEEKVLFNSALMEEIHSIFHALSLNSIEDVCKLLHVNAEINNLATLQVQRFGYFGPSQLDIHLALYQSHYFIEYTKSEACLHHPDLFSIQNNVGSEEAKKYPGLYNYLTTEINYASLSNTNFIAEQLNQLIGLKDNKVAGFQQKIQEHEMKIKELNRTIQEAQANIEAASKKEIEMGVLLNNYQGQLEEMNKKQLNENGLKMNLNAQISELTKQNQALQAASSKFESQKIEFAQQQLMQQNAMKAKYELQIADLTKQLQVLQNNAKGIEDKFAATAQESNKKMTEYKNIIQEYQRKIDGNELNAKKDSDANSAKAKEIIALKAEITTLKANITNENAKQDAKIKEYNKNAENYSKQIKEMTNVNAKLSQENSRLKFDKSTYENIIKENEKVISSMEEKLKQLKVDVSVFFDQVCDCCKEKRMCSTLQDGHKVCQVCLINMTDNILTHGKKELYCPSCKRVLNEAEYPIVCRFSLVSENVFLIFNPEASKSVEHKHHGHKK